MKKLQVDNINNNVFIKHYVVMGGKRRGDLNTISLVVGIGPECVYVTNHSHTGRKQVNQEDIIELLR